MKASELIKVLEKHPNADVIFWDGNDNFDITDAELDDCNKIEICLSCNWLID